MWSVVLKILSILGIILLCLLALALITVLLVLFWPVAYRGTGTARPGEYRACFRFRWLFGLVRGMYAYPEDGKLRIKVLWMTVYESGRDDKSGKTPKESSEQHDRATPDTQNASLQERSPRESTFQEQEPQQSPLQEKNPQEATSQEQELQQTTSKEKNLQEATSQEQELQQNTSQEKNLQEATSQEQGSPEVMAEEQIPKKVQSEERAFRIRKDGESGQKRQNTDLKEKLLFYLGILQNKDNQELVRYGMGRLGKIVKHIRPRYLRVQAVAGFGEPDLTGYAYGAYWAIKPFLGKRCRIDIIPDFERRILEGEAVLRGRLMAATILYHVCGVLFDRRLRQLLDQLK